LPSRRGITEGKTFDFENHYTTDYLSCQGSDEIYFMQHYVLTCDDTVALSLDFENPLATLQGSPPAEPNWQREISHGWGLGTLEDGLELAPSALAGGIIA